MYKQKCTMLYFGAVLLFLPAASIHAQVAIPITISSPDFNCTTSAGGQAFAVTSWSWGAQNTASPESTSPASPSVTAGPLRISKAADACSPVLLSLALAARELGTVTLVDNQAKQIVALSGVFVNVDESSDSDGGKPKESLSFNFTKIKVTYTQQNQEVCWDNLTKRSGCSGA
jgi:type VI protein secretion system component Hcp